MTPSQSADRISLLEEQVRQLKEALGVKIRFPSGLHLSKHESVVLGILLAQRSTTRQVLIQAMYADGNGVEWENRMLSMVIFALRKKVGPLGVKILTCFGVGYEISEQSQTNLRAVIRRFEMKGG